MTQIKKFSFGALAVAVVAVMALATMVQTAEALVTPNTQSVTVGTTVTVAVEDDANAVDVGYVSVNVVGSTGVVELATASGTMQSLVCLDNTTCDSNNTVGDITFKVNTVGAGSVIIDVDAFLTNGTNIVPASSQFALTVNAAPGGVSVAASPSTINAVGGATTVTATVTTSTGAAVANGTSVTVSTSSGTLSGCTGNGNGTQVCSTTVAGGLGQAAVTLTGGGLPGTATVTASSGGQSGSTSVILSGPAANVAISLKAAAMTGTTANANWATVKVTDTAGNPVSGVTPTVTVTSPALGKVALDPTFDPAGSVGPCSATTNSAGQCAVGITGVSTTGVQTLRARVTVGSTNYDATVDLRIAKALSQVQVSIGELSNGLATVTVMAQDADGNPAADVAASGVAGASSAGAIVNCSGIRDGVGTCTFVAPTQAGVVTVSAVVTINNVTKLGSNTVQIGSTSPTPGGGASGEGTFAAAPSFGTGNVGSAVFNGGTIEQLAAAVTAAGGTSVWAQAADGSWVRYNTLATGVTAFVNNAFNAEFASGFAGATAVFVVK